MLVRRNGVEGKDRDEDQRFVLGYDKRRRGEESGGDRPDCPKFMKESTTG